MSTFPATAQQAAAFASLTVAQVDEALRSLGEAYTSVVPAIHPDPASTAAIDDALNGICACGCGQPIPPEAVSAYFINDEHQDTWYDTRATDPGAVYRSEDPDYEYPGDIGTARWAPDLRMTDPGPIEPLTGDEHERLTYNAIPDGYTAAWGLRNGRYVLRLDDGHRYVERFVERVPGDLPARDHIHAEWETLTWDLTDARRQDRPPRAGITSWEYDAAVRLMAQLAGGPTVYHIDGSGLSIRSSPVTAPAHETGWMVTEYVNGPWTVSAEYDTGIKVTFDLRPPTVYHGRAALRRIRALMRGAGTAAEQWQIIRDLNGIVDNVRVHERVPEPYTPPRVG